MNFQKTLLSCIFLISSISILFSQSYSDGPISVDVKLREVQGNFAATDESLLGLGFAPDELTFYIWAQDNLLTYPWTPTVNTPYQDNNFVPTLVGTPSIDFNSTFASFNFTNTIVPEFIDLRIDAWEDDNPEDNLIGFCNNGTNTTFEDIQCSGIGAPGLCNSFLGNICFTNPSCPTYYTNLQTGATSSDCCLGIFCGDDYRCDANPFFQGLDYRLGPPCQTYDHGYVNGNSSCDPNYSINPAQPNTDGFYKPHIETFWRYTKGTSFFHAIDLGSVTSGTSIAHFNSNECYTDYYPASTGNDVIYSFNVVNPIGVNISLCGIHGAQFDSYLYLVKDTALVALSENDNSCGGLQSQITTSLCTPGTYYVVVDATSPSLLGTFTIEINEDPASSFSVVDSISDYYGEDISCNGGSDGKFYAHINGGTAPYTFDWSNGLNHTTPNSNDSITGLSAGNYSVIVTDSKGCILPTLSVTLNEPLQIVVTTNPTSPLCNGGNDGTITVTNTSGGISTFPYSYSWNTTPTPQLGSTAISLSAGIYTLTVTDVNGCFITHLETVTDPAAPSMNITSSNLPVNNNPLTYQVCDGNDITLTASPGFSSYSWNPNIWLNTNSGPTVTSSPNSGITYTCTGTDALGCTIDIPIILEVVSSVSMYASDPSPQVCEGEDIEIIWYGAPGTNFDWDPPIHLSSNSSISGQPITISTLDTITYTVTAQNASGCTDETKLFVDVLPAPAINSSTSSSICDGTSVQLTASGGNSYVWSPASSLNNNTTSVVMASPLSNTIYKVVGRAPNGCKDSATTQIDIYPLTNLSVTGDTSICLGESTQLSVSSGAISYGWTPSTSLNTPVGHIVLANPQDTTTYTITWIDQNGCEGDTIHTVSVLPVPNVWVTADDTTICIGEPSNLMANGAFSYSSWIPLASLNTITGTGPMVTATPTTTTTYSVIGIDTNNCSSTSLPITINVNPLPILSFTPPFPEICKGDSVVITASGAQDFWWDPPLGLNTSSGHSVVASPDTTTDYIITGEDTNNCLNVIPVSVIVNTPPTITLSSVPPNTHDICEGASLTINAFAFGGVSYYWVGPNGFTSTSQSIIASPTSAGSLTYFCTVDDGSCTNIANFPLNVGINPTVSITADPNPPIICEGQSAALLADGANNYEWKTPSNTLSSLFGPMVTATPLISTKYILEGTDTLGCIGTDSLVISVNLLPTANIISGGGMICSGDSAAIIVDVSGNPPWDITYSVDGAVHSVVSSTNPTIILSPFEGTYTIPYIKDNTCSNVGSGTEYVDVLNNPQASIDYNPENPNMLNPQVSFINNSIFSSTYLWQFGDNTPYSLEFNPVHTYQEDGTYTVVLLAENGPCVDTDSIGIVIDPYYALYVPNTFSPNGDGTNDNFEPKGIGIESFEIYIYNRWGDEVFYSDNFDIVWNGGEGIAGTYTYVISVVDKIGEFHKKNGFILIE